MKKFLIKLIIFIMPIILLSIPLDYFLSNHLKNSNSCNGEFLVWNDIFNSRVNSDIVIYGSSKAWVSFSPKIIEDSLKCTAYNLGIDGHNFWLEYLRHKELLKYNTTPKYIILSLDMFSLEKRPDLYNMDQFLPYMLFNYDFYNFTSSFKGFTFTDYYIPLIRYLGRKDAILDAVLCATKIVNSEPMRIKGYRSMELTWNNDFEIAKSKMDYYEVKTDEASEELFNSFLSECIMNNIKVFLVYSPEYIEGQDFFKNRNKIISIYEEYSKKYNIPFINYSDSLICEEKRYFYNSTHLNRIGSELFTNCLVRDLKELMP